MKLLCYMVLLIGVVSCSDSQSTHTEIAQKYLNDLKDDAGIGNALERLTFDGFIEIQEGVALEAHEYCYKSINLTVNFNDAGVNKSESYANISEQLSQRVPVKTMCFDDFKLREVHGVVNGEAWQDVEVVIEESMYRLTNKACQKSCGYLVITKPSRTQGNIGFDMDIAFVNHLGESQPFTSGSFKIFENAWIGISSYHNEDNLLNGRFLVK